jgi:hypothetical protein
MHNLPTLYEAELEYRREQVMRDWRPIRARRRARTAERDRARRAGAPTDTAR